MEQSTHQEGGEVSKSFLLLGGVLALILSSAFIPARWIGLAPKERSYTPVDFKQINSLQQFAQDTDKDGQVSWGELVTSTAEGSSSVSELSEKKADPKVISKLNDPNNLTASFSKNLYVKSTYLKNNNITDSETQQSVMDDIIAEESAKTTAKVYLYADINVAKTESKESIKKYGNNLGVILKDVITKRTIQEDLAGMTLFVKEKDEKYLEAPLYDAQRLNGVVQKLLKEQVPPSAVFTHLTILNQINSYKMMVEAFSKASEDPLRTTIALKEYDTNITNMILLYQTLTTYFKSVEVTFTSNEAGYGVTTGYKFK